jgi:hypothetical protein
MAGTHDARSAARVATLAACVVIAGFVAGKAARDAILLSAFPVEMLPVFVGAAAVLSLPLVILAGRIMVRTGPARLAIAINLISVALLVGEWLLLPTAPRVAAIACYFHIASFGAMLVSAFWSIINERFDAQSAKQHIGRIGLGATVGGVIGGVIAERCAVYLELRSILIVLAGLHVVAAIVLAVVAPDRPARRAEGDASAEPPATYSALRQVARTPLLRNLALEIVLCAIGAAALDYVFKAEVTRSSGDAGPLRLFAIYYTATNVLTALIQLVLARAVVTSAGVPRTIGVLPGVLAASGAAAVVVPGLWPILIARSAEAITRSSIYRAAYELIYAPLPERDKRPTKVVLDVGAERAGDLIGAQIITAIVFLVAAPTAWLLGAAAIAGVVAFAFAARLPRSYRTALEHSLEAQAGDADPGAPTPEGSALWSTMHEPNLSEYGDRTSMSLLDLRAVGPPSVIEHDPRAPRRTRRIAAVVPDAAAPSATGAHDPIARRVADLRSGDAVRARTALVAPLPSELAAHAIALVGWDVTARASIRALRAIAPRCTGTLVDALLDATQEFTIRRRLPAVIEAGEPALARWALWRGLTDARFEVRYRCARSLARMQEAGRAPSERLEEVLALISRELEVDAEVWRSHRLLDGSDDGETGDGGLDGDGYEGVTDGVIDAAPPRTESHDAHDAGALQRILRRRSAIGLDHVFTLLGLALPPRPVRIAFEGLFTDDRTLRGTAIEYLESVLPPEVREPLWPMIEADKERRSAPRPTAELAAALVLSHPNIVANLRGLAERDRG